MRLRRCREKKIQKNETIQPMEVKPSRRIHMGASGLWCVAIRSAGSHMSKISIPIAIQLTTTTFKGLFRSAGVSRKGPRKKIISTSAVSHSTDVLKKPFLRRLSH